MSAELKAVVFRTSRLKETREFFISRLGLTVKESSTNHFVIHTKGIRLLFVESGNDLEVELYVSNEKSYKAGDHIKVRSISKKPALAILEDPNKIKIIISRH